jgi:hypothetical protein
VLNDTCSVEGCNTRVLVRSRGLCSKHYDRWRRHGDPYVTLRPNLILGTPEERFRVKVSTPDHQGCLLWNAGLNRNGYGIFLLDGKSTLAHRVAYEMYVGPIPTGLSLDHVCHNRDKGCQGGSACKHRRCTNVQHLEPVTRRENLDRGRDPNSNRTPKTHCANNHPFTPENTLIDQGKRRCKTCRRSFDRKRIRK